MYGQKLQLSLPNKQRMSLLHFILIASVTVFLYFELMTQIWFVKLLGGYVVKVWVLPFVLFIYLIIKKLGGKGDLLKVNLINIMLVNYAVFGIVSMFLNETMHNAIKYYLIMIAPVWFLAVIIDNFKDNRDIELMIKVLLICSFLLSVYTYNLQLQYKKSPSSITRKIIAHHGGELELSEAAFVEKGVEHSRGLRGYEHGKYCGMLAPAILFSILFLLKSGRKIKYIYIAISFFMIFQIIKTLSRSGIVSTFIGIVVLISCIYIHEKKGRTKIFLFSLLIFVPIIIYLFEYQFNAVLRLVQLLNILGINQIDNYLYTYGLTSFSSDAYLDPHYLYYGESLDVFVKNPIFGIGYRFSELVLRGHNRYLFILTSSGLITFIPYILFLIGLTILIRKGMLNFRHYKPSGINYGYFFYACNIMFLFKLLNEGMETFYYWIFFALAIAWIRNYKREALRSKKIMNGMKDP